MFFWKILQMLAPLEDRSITGENPGSAPEIGPYHHPLLAMIALFGCPIDLHEHFFTILFCSLTPLSRQAYWLIGNIFVDDC